MIEKKTSADEFLAMLAHERRNPLTPVRTAIVIIRTSQNDPAVIEWSCQIMERQVQHMTRLLEDLLGVSRIPHWQIQFNKENTDLIALARGSVDALRIV